MVARRKIERGTGAASSSGTSGGPGRASGPCRSPGATRPARPPSAVAARGARHALLDHALQQSRVLQAMQRLQFLLLLFFDLLLEDRHLLRKPSRLGADAGGIDRKKLGNFSTHAIPAAVHRGPGASRRRRSPRPVPVRQGGAVADNLAWERQHGGWISNKVSGDSLVATLFSMFSHFVSAGGINNVKALQSAFNPPSGQTETVGATDLRARRSSRGRSWEGRAGQSSPPRGGR